MSSPTRPLVNDPDCTGNVWQTLERLTARVAHLEADVEAGIVDKRGLWGAVAELASRQQPLTACTAALVARVAGGVSLDELAGGGTVAGVGAAVVVEPPLLVPTPSLTNPPSSLDTLTARITELELKNGDLEDALLAAPAPGDCGAAERAAQAVEAANALAAQNALLAARLRALNERAPAVAAAGEMLEALRDEAAGLRADNARLAGILDTLQVGSNPKAGMARQCAQLRDEAKALDADRAAVAADLRAAKRALAASSAPGTPSVGGVLELDAAFGGGAGGGPAHSPAAPGGATAALLAAELRNARTEIEHLKQGSGDAAPASALPLAPRPSSATTPRSPSLRALLSRTRPSKADRAQADARIAQLAQDNARLLEENARLAARAHATADRAAEAARRDGKSGRLTQALAGLVDDLTRENAVLVERALSLAGDVRSLAGAHVVDAAFAASEDGASAGPAADAARALAASAAADADAARAARVALAERASGALAGVSREKDSGGEVAGGGVCLAVDAVGK